MEAGDTLACLPQGSSLQHPLGVRSKEAFLWMRDSVVSAQ